MSSSIYRYQNRQIVTEMACHLAVGASLIMVVYVLAGGAGYGDPDVQGAEDGANNSSR